MSGASEHGTGPEAPQQGLSRPELVVLAHELRGALTVVAGYAELLKRGLADQERDAAIEGVERAVRRADGLIGEALDGRATAAADEVFERLDLASLVIRVAGDQRAATGRSIETVIDSHDAILGDADALARLLGNVIDNAAKYSPAHQPVLVRVTERDDWAVVEVSDRGPGIAEKDRETVFEPFERLGGHPGVSGSGVGLAVVRQVAERHGGRVRIESRPGGGTTVVVELPAIA